MPKFGRLLAVDERDRQYPAQAALPAEEPERTYKYWPHRTKLDQGQTGTCVAHGCTHLVENSPICPPGTINPFELYREIVLLDEWSDNDGEASAADSDMQFGTSVRAGMKALQARGLISEYRWAWDADTAARWIWTSGPVVIGVTWFNGLFYPDPRTRIVEATGGIAGGHCVILDGVNMTNRMVRFLNSWGPSYGQNGAARMTFETLDKLLADEGEAAMAIEVSQEVNAP